MIGDEVNAGSITISLLPDVEVEDSGIKHYFDNAKWIVVGPIELVRQEEKDRWKEKLINLSSEDRVLHGERRTDGLIDISLASATGEEIFKDYVGKYSPLANKFTLYHGSRRDRKQFEGIKEKIKIKPIKVKFHFNDNETD